MRGFSEGALELYGQALRDFDRAAQWCRKVETWAERAHVPYFQRTCRAHYAGVLIWRGFWDRAESELAEVAEQLADIRPPAAVEALVRLGELRRRQGQPDKAAAIFDQVAEHPKAILGAGELRLDLDDPAGACERAEEYLRQASSGPATPRAAGLELLARAAARLGDLGRATVALTDLSAIAERIPTDPVRAALAYTRGVVSSAHEDHDRARIAFEDAIRYYHRAQAPFEEAKARLALAQELSTQARTADAHQHAHRDLDHDQRVGHPGRLADTGHRGVAGVPGLLGYRALNTVDAMVGHKTPRHRRFGWAAARGDDAANVVPARVSALAAAACAPTTRRSCWPTSRPAPSTVRAGWRSSSSSVG
jgi:tetratricopeptide (TPR) repeat protein